MIKLRSGLFFLLIVLTVSCQKNQPAKPLELPNPAMLPGLASPIQLDFQQTRVILGDYFMNPEKLDSIHWPESLEAKLVIDSQIVYLKGNINSPFDVASFYSGTDQFDILIKRSDYVLYKFFFPDEEESINQIMIKGSFNAWNVNANSFVFNDGAWETDLLVKPGTYEYALVIEGESVLDPNNSDSVSNGLGGWNSQISIGEETNRIYILNDQTDANSIHVTCPSGTDLFAFYQNSLMDASLFNKDETGYTIEIPNYASNGRSFIRIIGSNGNSISNDLLIPLEDNHVVENTGDLNRSDWENTSMYFMMVDRFKNGNTENDATVADPSINPKANFYGGDIAGIDEKLLDGYFDQLGIGTIWISPISKNPRGAWGLWDKGGVTSTFSGYHGYWPVSNVKPDQRFGTKEEITKMIDDSHAKGLNVLLDYVANHVHKEHPIYQKNPDWATDLYLPDGTMNTERWDDHRLTTWFDTFLPTLDLRKPEIVEPLTDSALVWVTEYEFDGFRHDATKHIDELYWRVLMKKLKQNVMIPQGKRIFQIGETYGSPDLINSYISSGKLDAQFDFNLYDASVDAFANENSLERLQEILQSSLDTYGHHHLMGNISGNQDRSRFITLADGDLSFAEDKKLAGWTREFGKPKPDSYRKLSFLHAFNFSIPGIPVIYYGDEIGLWGADDPDNRKMMRFDEWDADEQALFNQVSKLTELRKTELALSYGTTQVEVLEEHTIIIKRQYLDQIVVAVINQADKAVEFSVESGLNSVFNTSSKTSEGLWTIEANSFDYLISSK